jgi:cell shape-determining protein MreC
MHLDEVATLKVKVQSLETENMTLKSSCTSTNITSMNLYKFVGQKSSNKSGLRYKIS